MEGCAQVLLSRVEEGVSSAACGWLNTSFDALLTLVADVAEAARRKKEEKQQKSIKETLGVLAKILGVEGENTDRILEKAKEMIGESGVNIKGSQDGVRQQKIALFKLQAESNKTDGGLTARMNEVQTAISKFEETIRGEENKKQRIEELTLHVSVLEDMLDELRMYPEGVKKEILEAKDLMDKSILALSRHHQQT